MDLLQRGRNTMKFQLKRDTADMTCYIVNIVLHSNLLLNTICYVYTTEHGVRYWKVTSS